MEEENELDIEFLAELVAYHEASHFVLALLMNKFDSSFGKPSAAALTVIMGQQLKRNSFIISSSPELDKEILGNDKMKIKHIFGECFILLAGDASAKVFYDKGYRFIHELNAGALPAELGTALTEDAKSKFISLGDQLMNYKISPDHDVTKTVNLLNAIIDFDKDGLAIDSDAWNELIIRIIDFIVEKLYFLMGEEPVKKSIELVKDELLNKNGEVIKNGALDALIGKVEQLISDVDVSGYLDACADALESDNWKIEPSGGGIDFV